MKIFLTYILLLFGVLVSAQEIVALRATYDDSFREWTIVTADEGDFDGTLSLTFGGVNNDFTDWSFDLPTVSGSIRQKWSSSDRVWELAYDGDLITIERVWPGDNREWKIYDGQVTQVIKTRYGNTADEWIITDEKDGYFDIFTQWQGDPRDWIIEENLSSEYSLAFKVALAFTAVYNSMPKQ